jgi:aryl-alcohol dehydrogenase-like predicted oxidoreductase
MEYRTITNTDLKVSKICLGTMNMGTYNTEAEGHEQLDYALSEGVNFIDTAEYYPIPPTLEKQGDTETYIGNWIKKREKRDDFYLTSKVSSGVDREMRTRKSSGSLNRQEIRDAIDGSLERLKTDYIDLYQVHFPNRDTNIMGRRGVGEINDSQGIASIEETLETLNEIVKAGKVRYIGVSNETPWGLYRYLHLAEKNNWARIVTIQNQYSILNRTFEIGLSEFALREGVELLAYSPLNKSVLSGKYIGGVIPEGSRFAYSLRDFDRYNPEHAQVAIEKYASLAKENNMSLVELSLAFVNSRPFLASNIIGATNLEQLKEDIGSINITLGADVMSAIADIYRENPDPTC